MASNVNQAASAPKEAEAPAQVAAVVEAAPAVVNEVANEPAAAAVAAAANVLAPVEPVDESADEGDDIDDDAPESGDPGRELTEDEKYAREVRQTWRNMTDKELRETMAKPRGAAELVRVASQMHEEQLTIIAPLMTDAQIASTIPSLQLQHQGALVQGFSAHQIRHAVRSIPSGDRQLLVQNITLITSSETDPSKDEEMQGIIGFIDPLVMAIAVERPDLVEKVLRAACIMTPEQIRVMVPLVPLSQIRTMVESIVSAEGHAMVLQMLLPEQRKELEKECQNELSELQSALRKVTVDVAGLADTKLPDLSRQVHAFCNKPLTTLATNEHSMLHTRLVGSKTQLERCHREIRSMQRKLKLSQILLKDGVVAEGEETGSKPSEDSSATATNSSGPASVASSCNKTEDTDNSNMEAIKKTFNQIQEDLVKLGKTVSQQYLILDNSGENTHGLLHKLHDTWSRLQAENVGSNNNDDAHHSTVPQEERIYIDSDLSTTLYTAVQAIGNPGAIGDIYNFTWNDIIDLGFRTAEDFTAKGITNLKQLETLIHTHKGIKTNASNASEAASPPVAAEQ